MGLKTLPGFASYFVGVLALVSASCVSCSVPPVSMVNTEDIRAITLDVVTIHDQLIADVSIDLTHIAPTSYDEAKDESARLAAVVATPGVVQASAVLTIAEPVMVRTESLIQLKYPVDEITGEAPLEHRVRKRSVVLLRDYLQTAAN